MKTVLIDFESYYDDTVSVVNLGNANYVAATDAYLVAVSVDGEAQCGTLEELGPLCARLAKDPEARFWAANSNFDQAWFEKYWGPTAHPWQCVLDLGAFHQLPRNLADLAKVVLGQAVDKTLRDRMKGVHYEALSAPEQEKMQEYCLGDVLTMAHLLDVLPAMSETEARVAAHTRLVNRRGVRINRELVERDKTLLEEFRFEQLRRVPWRAEAPPLSYQALVRWCAAQGIPAPKSTAKTDEECADLMSEHPALDEMLKTLRAFRRSNVMLRKIEALLSRVTPEGQLPLDLMYCGAPHTRRWSSRGFNVQNLDKEPVDLGGGKRVWSRNWITPAPGKVFYIADYAQIEPRCLNWLVGNEEMMSALRTGYSYYEAYARAAKGWAGAPGTLKAEFGKARYTKLKNEALGCGYGMGAARYTSYAGVSADEARTVIEGFRLANPKVVAFWRRLDRMIEAAARDLEHLLSVEMPSGDTLKHFYVRAARNGYESFTVKGDFGQQSLQPRLWGGTLTENVTQRMARDVLAEAVLRLEAAGLPVLFHAHDEVIVEVEDTPLARAEAEKEITRLMTLAPNWASDLPLAVEGSFATAYTK